MLTAPAVCDAEAGRPTRRLRGDRERVSRVVKTIARPAHDAYRLATTTPLDRLIRRPWRVQTAGDLELGVGDRLIATLEPLGVLGIDVPIEITRLVPGVEIAYRYAPGGVSVGDNTIRFEPSRGADGHDETTITHTSRYRITHPILRRIPPLYRWGHERFVRGLIRQLAIVDETGP
jgi:hypothetical protein